MGADVMGRDGKLGELSRMIVDPREDAVTGIVVKHGMLMSTEYVVPLAAVEGSGESELRIDANEEELKQFQVFNMANYREPDPDYTGPPGFDRKSMGIENLQYTSFVAMGPMVGLGAGSPVFGFPGGEQYRPPRMAWSTVHDGSDVLDCEGEKVGEVAEFGVDQESGQPTRLVIKQGFLFKKETELPAEWVGDLEDDAVILRQRKSEVEKLAAG
jgi:sporulation protein YlmC with PRC-barrel domain